MPSGASAALGSTASPGPGLVAAPVHPTEGAGCTCSAAPTSSSTCALNSLSHSLPTILNACNNVFESESQSDSSSCTSVHSIFAPDSQAENYLCHFSTQNYDENLVVPCFRVVCSTQTSEASDTDSEVFRISNVTARQETASTPTELQSFQASAENTPTHQHGQRLNPRAKPKPMALDLFSGKGLVRLALEKRGFEVVSLDIDPRFNPQIVCDIMQWDYRGGEWNGKKFRPGFFKVVCASPPCTEYSRAKTIGWRRMEESDQLVLRTLEIVEFFRPDLWWLENPRSGFLVRRPCVSGLPFIDVDYCQFADWGYQKPTRIWGSESLLSLGNAVCDGQSCTQLVKGENGRWRHRERLGGRRMKYTTYHKWKVPEKLVFHLLSVLDHGEEKFNFKRVDYAVRNEFFKMIEQKFQRRVDRDCFADRKNALCTAFFTESDNALEKEWGEGETLWLNPPWSLWRKVTAKLKKSKSDAICILPDWRRGWVRELVREATSRIYFHPGTRLFEVDGKPVGPTKWGVWALLIQKKTSTNDFSTRATEVAPSSSPERKDSDKVVLRARMLQKVNFKGKGRKVAKGDRQLVMRTTAILPNGKEQVLNVLVDTGAEACLVRKGLMPEHLTHLAPKPLKFETADGQPLKGGRGAFQFDC